MAHSLTMVLTNRRSELERVAQAVHRFGEEHGLPHADVVDVDLVLDEIVTNVIEHGYEGAREGDHEIHLAMTLTGGTLTIEVADQGQPFNPLDAPPPNLDLPLEERPIGGLGIFLVKSLTTTIDYRRDSGRNILTMTKAIRDR